MAGRGPRARGGSGRRSARPKTEVGRMLQDYFQPALHSTDFNALASGGDLRTVLVDNSADFSNSVLKWAKLTIRPIWDADDLEQALGGPRTMAMMLLKQDEDDSTVHSIDNAESVRELRNKKRILRGPWWVTSPGVLSTTGAFIPPMAGHMKAIVLENFVLDREEDLIVTFTNVSSVFPSESFALDYAMKGFVRVIS